MNGCDLFDDQHPTGGLPRWATMTQVSAFLEIPCEAVRSVVRRAAFHREQWVKKERCEEGKTLYLIDTDHPLYKAHEERWKQNKALRAALLDDSLASWSSAAQTPFSGGERAKISFPFSTSSPLAALPRFSWPEQDHAQSKGHQWSLLRQWLYAQGIQIFKNVLAEEGQANPWQWRWHDLHGEGYPDEEEAMIAALQAGLDANREAYEEGAEANTSLLPAPVLEQPPGRKWLWFLPGCNCSPLF